MLKNSMSACLVVVAAFVAFGLFPTEARAGVSPVGLAIIPPVQFPPDDFTVTGVRVSALWGNHREVYGLDVGALGNITTVNSVGLSAAGGFNYNKGVATVVGFQVAGGANINVNHTKVIGLQIAGLLNNNQAESSVAGLQFALVNYGMATTIYGIEVGLYNRAVTVNGFQIGLINYTQNLHGLQIGLINFNTKGLFAVAPILNAGF